MKEIFTNLLRDWNSQKSEREKLQQAYIATVFCTAVIAGLATLLNQTIGRFLLIISAGSGVVFIVNAVTWALLEAFIIHKVKKTKP